MSLAQTIEGVLSTAGGIFRTGELKGKLIRVTGRTGPSYAPTRETTATYDFVSIWGEFTAEERALGLVVDGDHRLEIGADSLTVAPQAGDKVEVQGVTYQVKTVDIVRPAGVALLYRLKVRA